VLKGGMESWSGVLKTPSWSVVYDFSVDVFCKLGILNVNCARKKKSTV
jgi:hypothetical protein